jgi:hypothetical protein
LFQAEEVREAVCGCEWVGTPVRFQSCILFMIAKANKEFILTAGKFVPVSNKTMMNVRTLIDCVFYIRAHNCENTRFLIEKITQIYNS